MQKVHLLLLVAGIFLVLASPNSAFSQSLEFGLKGFYGIAGGTTDGEDRTGEAGPASGAGLVANLYVFEFGKFRVGISSGLEITNLSYLYYQPVTVPVVGEDTKLEADVSYPYAVVPASIKVAYELNERLALSVDVGAYFGFFLRGISHNKWDPPVPTAGLVEGTETLDESNTHEMDVGARVAVGIDIEIGETLILTPGLMFDYGFSDITKDVPVIPNARDTFWKIVVFATVGFRLF